MSPRDARFEKIGGWSAWLMLLGTLGVPASLLWDFSFESTIGIDLFFSPPHVATYLAVALAGAGAFGELARATRAREAVAIGRLRAPLGAWAALWGVLAFVTALLFERWWQQGYGLAAGIWHPPQMLKATAFFALAFGALSVWAERQSRVAGAIAFCMAGGAVLALIGVVTLPSTFANRQRGALFYQLACATYPIVLVALARAGRLRFAATLGAGTALALQLALVWLLPLVPGTPGVGPIYNPRDHLLPPPFPLLLVVPALALDVLLRRFATHGRDAQALSRALEAGAAFTAIFVLTQWGFAGFLLSPEADGWLFAGGGRHWPFFLRIEPSARTAFWESPDEAFTLARAALVAGLAVLAAWLGLRLGAGLRPVGR